MGRYKPTVIAYQGSGLDKSKDAFILADDAYQTLENIWQWRGRLRRREGYNHLGRLQRIISGQALAGYAGTQLYQVADILSSFRATEPDAQINAGSVVVSFAGAPAAVLTDNGSASWTVTGATLYPAQSITGIVAGATTVINFGAAHEFQIGGKVYISGIAGMTELNETVATITAIGATTITVSVDSSSFTAWVSGGTCSGNWLNYNTAELHIQFLLAALPGAGAVSVSYGYFPCLPVMGLPSKQLVDINSEQSLAFDTRYAYTYSNTNNRYEELTAATATTWTGDDLNYFWSTNYWYTADRIGYFWTTNFSGISGDPIRVYDGVDWYDFAPYLDNGGTTKMHQCLMLIPYKGRIVALNTFEGGTLATSNQFAQRARWSQSGAPLSSVTSGTAPTATDEWRSDVRGRGGYVDCPTNEHIVSAEFIRDILIVGFENSTWALRYTGNELLPFVWERINRELGTESTFSMVPFDKGILAVGDKAITTCNGNNVERIDEAIPNQVFEINNSFNPSSEVSTGSRRVHGVRDFFERVVYWTFPAFETNANFADRLLVFNYHNQTWAIFTDSFTCFGNYQRFNDVRWSDLGSTQWQAMSEPWVSAKFNSQFPDIIAGNQRGYVSILNQKVTNDKSLDILSITGGASAALFECPDHNLQTEEFIKVVKLNGLGYADINNRIFMVERSDSDNLKLWEAPWVNIQGITRETNAVVNAPGHNFVVGQTWYIFGLVSGMVQANEKFGKVLAVNGDYITIDLDTSDYSAAGVSGHIQNLDAELKQVVLNAGTYLGGGSLERVMGFEARSKKFNFMKDGKKAFLGYIDFLTQRTDNGEVAVNIYIDYDDKSPVNNQEDEFYNSVISTAPSPIENNEKSKNWHRFYCPTDAQFFEYGLTLNQRQLFNPNVVNSEVLIDAVIIYSEVGGRLVE